MRADVQEHSHVDGIEQRMHGDRGQQGAGQFVGQTEPDRQHDVIVNGCGNGEFIE